MIYVGLLLVGIGLTDFVHAVVPRRHLPELVGAFLTVGIALLAGLTDSEDLVVVALVVVALLAWGTAVTYGFATQRPWVPLGLLFALLAIAIGASPLAPTSNGLMGSWLEATPVPYLQGMPSSRAILLFGALLVQCATGNTVVRLALMAATPQRISLPLGASAQPPRSSLGRLIGPAERVLILGAVAIGAPTVAGIGVAIKALIGFPELKVKAEKGESVAVIRDYFLFGSLVSCLVAVSTLVLLKA